jgi:mRNA interferase RelE/StbE
MGWKVELAESAERELAGLDPQNQQRILSFLRERVAGRDDPRSIGQALRGSRVGEFWKYRVGDFRLLGKIEDDRQVVLILRVGHRKDIYR